MFLKWKVNTNSLDHTIKSTYLMYSTVNLLLGRFSAFRKTCVEHLPDFLQYRMALERHNTTDWKKWERASDESS